MHVELITEWRALDALALCWNALLCESEANTLFLTWEWMQSWIRSTGWRQSPLVAVAHDGGAACGIAPFYVARYKLLGAKTVRVLQPMGDMGADYPDVIVRRDRAEEISRALFGALEKQKRRWDCLWLTNVRGWNGATQRLLRTTDRFLARQRPAEFCSVALPPTVQEFDFALSAKRRQELRRLRRNLLGQPGTAITRCEKREDLASYLNALFRLHTLRWQRKGEPGTFGPEKRELYRDFAPKALDRGWLSLYGLKANNEFKAVQIGYTYGDTYHAVQEGYDPDYSPGAGNVLRHEVFGACIKAGLKCYDFLGGMTEHKRMWQGKMREGADLFIGRRSALNRLLFRTPIWPSGRYLRPVDASTKLPKPVLAPERGVALQRSWEGFWRRKPEVAP
jgi:CelD/BcsL family acetyltransferase involved in cellulose biosynthesis